MADNLNINEIDEWRDVPGCKGVFEVSRAGVVRALDRLTKNGRRRQARILKGSVWKGYIFVTLSIEGVRRKWPVHRLVLETFVGPMPKGMQTCHNNGIRHDNRLENLRYDTPAGNQQDIKLHGTRNTPIGERCGTAKLSEQQVREIVALNGTMPQWAIGKRFGVSQKQISKILNGKRWAHVVRDIKPIHAYCRGEAHRRARGLL